MQSPVKKEYITQIFGANPAAYAQFGLKGHNGIDYRAFLPDGTRCYEAGKSEVFCPHDGKIIENAYDANGYGNYVKIENEIEGSVLAHFGSLCTYPVGTEVKIGQFLAYQGTTGNSSGIHLHWGYYKKPRDRSNGYAGFINQAGLYEPYQEVNMPETVAVEKAVFEELVRKSSEYDKLVASGYVLQADHDRIVNEKNAELDKKAQEIVTLQKQVDFLQSELDSCQATNNVEWMVNGKTVEVTEGNTKTILNYKRS